MLDARDKSRMATHFEQVARLVRLGLTYRLDYPRRYDSLPEVAEAVLKHTESMAAEKGPKGSFATG